MIELSTGDGGWEFRRRFCQVRNFSSSLYFERNSNLLKKWKSTRQQLWQASSAVFQSPDNDFLMKFGGETREELNFIIFRLCCVEKEFPRSDNDPWTSFFLLTFIAGNRAASHSAFPLSIAVLPSRDIFTRYFCENFLTTHKTFNSTQSHIEGSWEHSKSHFRTLSASAKILLLLFSS